MSRKCVNCGEEIKKTDVFCPFCGGPVDKIQSTPSEPLSSENVIICSLCGAANKPTSTFCESCGDPIVSSESAAGRMESSYGSTTYDSQAQASGTTYTYGSYSSSSSTGEKKWYTPPKRTRSAKNPIEWFFWSGWGLYILFRLIFSILWIVIRIIAATKK